MADHQSDTEIKAWCVRVKFKISLESLGKIVMVALYGGEPKGACLSIDQLLRNMAKFLA